MSAYTLSLVVFNQEDEEVATPIIAYRQPDSTTVAEFKTALNKLLPGATYARVRRDIPEGIETVVVDDAAEAVEHFRTVGG